MDGAAILLLAAGVGVSFGWQPMPDGSPRYEYIVQVEPAFAATLDAGSVPIASEIPEEIQPIGRVRVVVAAAAPPRQRLVTRMKPVTDAPTATGSGGVQLAQFNPYTQPADPRYAAVPQPGAPYGQSTTAPIPQPSVPAQDQPGQQWNGAAAPGVATSDANAAPTGGQLFGDSPRGTGAAWSNPQPITSAAVNASAAAGNALNVVGQTVQQAAQQAGQQMTEGLNKAADTSVREAVDALGDRTQNLINELRMPFSQQQGQPTQPQSGAAPAASSSWNQGQTAQPQIPQYTSPSQAGSTWNNQGPSSPGLTAVAGSAPNASASSQPVNAWPGNAPAPRSSATPAGTQPAPREWNAPPASAPQITAQQPAAPANDDPWKNVPDERLRTGNSGNRQPDQPPAVVPNLASRPAPFGGGNADWNTPTTTPQIPVMEPPQTPATAGANAVADSPAGAGAKPAGGAAVSSGMLSQPANRPLDGAPVGTAAQSPAAPQKADASAPWFQTASNPGPSAPLSANQPSADGNFAASAKPTRDNAALVLAAWVLLSGSVAGNFYLFWSYLDVRQKYRSLVRKTARAVGRFAAA